MRFKKEWLLDCLDLFTTQHNPKKNTTKDKSKDRGLNSHTLSFLKNNIPVIVKVFDFSLYHVHVQRLM